MRRRFPATASFVSAWMLGKHGRWDQLGEEDCSRKCISLKLEAFHFANHEFELSLLFLDKFWKNSQELNVNETELPIWPND